MQSIELTCIQGIQINYKMTFKVTIENMKNVTRVQYMKV